MKQNTAYSAEKVINSPSIANCSLLSLSDDIKKLRDGGVRCLHVDLADGHYAANFFFPIRVISDIKESFPDMVLDVHLMFDDPERFIDRICDAGADYVSFHADAARFVIRLLEQIRGRGKKAGVVINPSQDVGVIRPYTDLLDMVTLMAVEPGFAGQKFMPRTVNRTAQLSLLRSETASSFLINIDGAIKPEYVAPCIKNGADMIVTGNYTVFRQPDGIVSACRRFMEECEKGIRARIGEPAS